MTQRDPIAHSVHDRLLRIAADRQQNFNVLLARYAAERLLYRLTMTRHGKRFVLKGAMLFVLWLRRLHRPTRDLDLLGSGEITERTLKTIFEDVCKAQVEPDGLAFDPTSITVQDIRENQVYQGLRVKVHGRLGNARVDVQIDVGIGDAVTPGPVQVDFPTLLDLPAPHVSAYPAETAVAEKLDTMVQLGLRNSRMKDFYDLWLMSRNLEFDGPTLSESIRKTFEHRHTAVDPAPPCFGAEFAHDASKQIQWSAFTRRSRLSDAPGQFADVVEHIRVFLQPLMTAIAEGRDVSMHWPLGGPWQSPA